MSFNYGLEKKRFEAQWEQLRKEYSEAGMSAESIQEMYAYDLKVFNRRRADANHEQPFMGKSFDGIEENDESRSVLYEKFCSVLTCRDTYSLSERFAWIETIENEQLYVSLLVLSDEDKKLLTLIVEEGLTITEIAGLQRKSIPTIWKKVARIKKFLSNKAKKPLFSLPTT